PQILTRMFANYRFPIFANIRGPSRSFALNFRSFNHAAKMEFEDSKSLSPYLLLLSCALRQLAMPSAIGEVDDKAYEQPKQQTEPVVPSFGCNHAAADEDTHDGNKGHERRFERALRIPVLFAHDDDRHADQDEGKQGANARHIADFLAGYESRKESHQNKK